MNYGGKKISVFPAGPVIKCFIIPPNSKLKNNGEKSFALHRLAHKLICLGFKEHDLITCESRVHVVVSPGS